MKVLLVGLFVALYMFHCFNFYPFAIVSYHYSLCLLRCFQEDRAKDKRKEKTFSATKHEANIYISIYIFPYFFMLSQCTRSTGTWLLDNLQAFTFKPSRLYNIHINSEAFIQRHNWMQRGSTFDFVHKQVPSWSWIRYTT